MFLLAKLFVTHVIVLFFTISISHCSVGYPPATQHKIGACALFDVCKIKVYYVSPFIEMW